MITDRSPITLPRLHGRVAVVTGAGRGIGREVARVLAHLGATVLIAEVNESGAETEQLIRQSGGVAHFVQTDVASEESVSALRERVLNEWGRIDLLIHNATVFSVGPLWELPTAEWDRVMAVNLRGAFLCIRAFLPTMLAQRSGVVVTMESADGMPYIAPYLAAKVALRSLAQSLAQEVGEQSGVSVFCYGPGLVETPGLSQALEKLAPLYGLTRQEFVSQMEAQLVTPEVTATGLVGAVLFANEFHGQELGFAQGLARLGLTATGETLVGSVPAAAVEEGAALEAPSARHAATAEAPAEAEALLALNRRLEQILRENVREYDELNLFQRPIVRRMFQHATGLKVEEWLASAEVFTRLLEAGGRAKVESEIGRYVAQLQRLAQYIRKQETDARGFFKNPEDLARALEALRERHQTVVSLIAALEVAR